MVLAIYGPWGSGKTTVVNFTIRYLERQPDAPIIVYFNPWWFSSPEHLTRHFFDRISMSVKGRGVLGPVLRSRLRVMGDQLALAPSSGVRFLGWVAGLFNSSYRDVTEIKETVSKRLLKKKRRLLVVIDDIDRLTDEETREIFRVVKAGADFPNTSYLLSFDKEVVVGALQALQAEHGEDFLAKIVQVPFELPLPDRTSLRGLLTEKLDEIIANTPDGLFDSDRWRSVFWEGIDPFIETPRAVLRLTNSLAVTYPAVTGEVNTVDFLGIEAVRVFASGVYSIVRNNRDKFAGSISSHIGDQDPRREFAEFHNSWLNDVEESQRDAIRSLVRRLFPKVEAALGGPVPSAGLEPGWRKELRLCSAEVFPVYFRLETPSGEISGSEIRAFLKMSTSAPQVFGEALVSLTDEKRADGSTKARALLERLTDYLEGGVPSDQAVSILRALFQVGDELVRRDDAPVGMFDFGMDIQIGRVVYRALRSLDPSKRLAVLQEVVDQGKALFSISDEVATLGQEHGKYGAERPSPSEQKLLTLDELGQIEATLRNRLQQAARDGSLRDVPHLARMLYIWKELDSERPKQWVSDMVKEDSGLLILLDAFRQTSTVTTLGEVGKTETRQWTDPEGLKPFVEPEELIERIRQLPEGRQLTEDERRAVESFVEGYELRSKGIDPRYARD
jgi:predicted KAP-like P-loop ATPase